MSYDFPHEPLGPNVSRFALRLRWLRSAAGLTPHALAERADLPVASVMAYEAGRAPVTASALHRLAPALGIDQAFFFDPD